MASGQDIADQQNLALGQGGSIDEGRIDRVVGALERNLAEFGQAAKSIKSLTESVNILKKDVNSLKRKTDSNTDSIADGLSRGKRANCSSDSNPAAAPIENAHGGNGNGSSDNSDSDSDNDREWDTLQPNHDNIETVVDSLQSLEQFFEVNEEVGESVSENLGKIVNKALRGKKDNGDGEKLKTFRETYKRPDNLTNLQVPKVDEILWRNLRKDTKNIDYLHQRAINNYNFMLVPLLRALDRHISKNDPGETQKHLMDAIKITCLTIKDTNNVRAERIKKEIQPRYKSVCDNPPSAALLFGEDLADTVKKMEGPKLNITTTQPFLGRKVPAQNSRNQYSMTHSGKMRSPFQNQRKPNQQQSKKMPYKPGNRKPYHPHHSH